MLDMCGMSVRQCLGQGQDRASEELWHTGSRTSQLSHLSLLREHLEISGHSSATMWDRERVGRGLILTASSRWSQDDAKAPGRLRAATPKCKFLVPSGLESWPKKKKKYLCWCSLILGPYSLLDYCLSPLSLTRVLEIWETDRGGICSLSTLPVCSAPVVPRLRWNVEIQQDIGWDL